MIKDAFNSENFRKEGHTLIDDIATYLAKAYEGKELPVFPFKKPEDSYQFWKNYQLKDNNQLYRDLITHSTHLHHPGYIGHQISPAVPTTALPILLASLFKNGSGVYEMAPAGAALERIVPEEMAKYIGYDERASGIITSGGTLANLTALLCARQEKGLGDIWNDGLENNGQMGIMVSEASHYCIDRAARIMGFGAGGVVKVPMNDQYQIEVDQLEACYQKAIENGKQIFAIVGNACSTATGSYDDLEAIGEFAKKHNLWFHVDGAHGGAAIFSEKYKHLVKSIELADSVVIDFHKMMLTAGLCTTVVFKNGADSYKTFQVKAQYLFDDTVEEEWYNMAKRTFECTKFPNVFSVYALLQQNGKQLIESYIDTTYDLSKAFHQTLEADPNFETAHIPEANIVCFRYVDAQLDEVALNNLNKKIRSQLVQEGNFYIVQTVLNGQLYLRVSIMNPLTTKEHMMILIKNLKALAESFL